MSNAQSVTSAQVSSSKILEKGTPFTTALAWAQKGEIDRGIFVAWCCETRLDLAQAVPLLMPLLTGEQGAKDFAKIMAAQTQLLISVGQKSAGGQIRYIVSAKGAVSVYGLQRMPVTLYAEQWERFAEKFPAMLEWIKTNPTQEHEFYADEAETTVAKKDGKRTDVRPSVKRVVSLSRKAAK